MIAGEKAPDFTLCDHTGRPRTLSALLSEGPVVLFFFPIASSPICTAQACHFRDLSDEFTRVGAQRAGISTDTVDTQAHALTAITDITAAVQSLGLTQGSVGTGENALNYAISLAQSQITNDSASESSIRDADIATEASNLTKSQVLEQSSVAALAQANASPQALLKLLQ